MWKRRIARWIGMPMRSDTSLGCSQRRTVLTTTLFVFSAHEGSSSPVPLGFGPSSICSQPPPSKLLCARRQRRGAEEREGAVWGESKTPHAAPPPARTRAWPRDSQRTWRVAVQAQNERPVTLDLARCVDTEEDLFFSHKDVDFRDGRRFSYETTQSRKKGEGEC